MGTPVSTQGSFSSGKNGTITASPTVFPPDSTLDCPPGQQEVINEVSYADIGVTGLTNGIFEAATPSALTAVFTEL